MNSTIWCIEVFPRAGADSGDGDLVSVSGRGLEDELRSLGWQSVPQVVGTRLYFLQEADGGGSSLERGHLEEVATEWFATDMAKDAVRQKVAALFPEHEVEQFTDLFFDRIQTWRTTEGTAR